jgi:hypothetical protein
MEMRALYFLFALLLTGWVRCLGQQAAANQEDTIQARPAGTLVRPADGYECPELDRAWTIYGADVAKTNEAVRKFVADQFDDATAKGDLKEAVKWQKIGEALKNGQMPSAIEAKPVVDEAKQAFQEAKRSLASAYESTTQSLTRDKKIQDALRVDDEFKTLMAGEAPKPPIVAAAPPGPEERRKWLMGKWILNEEVEAVAKPDGTWTETNRNNGLLHAAGRWGAPDAQGFFKIKLSNGWTLFIRPTEKTLADVEFISPQEEGPTGQRVIQKAVR